jgi:hypothetical protein
VATPRWCPGVSGVPGRELTIPITDKTSTDNTPGCVHTPSDMRLPYAHELVLQCVASDLQEHPNRADGASGQRDLGGCQPGSAGCGESRTGRPAGGGRHTLFKAAYWWHMFVWFVLRPDPDGGDRGVKRGRTAAGRASGVVQESSRHAKGLNLPYQPRASVVGRSCADARAAASTSLPLPPAR